MMDWVLIKLLEIKRKRIIKKVENIVFEFSYVNLTNDQHAYNQRAVKHYQYLIMQIENVIKLIKRKVK